MRSVSVRLADLNKVTIPIGFVGENLHTQVRIDCVKLFEEYPNAVPTLTVNPPMGDTYPAIVTRDGDYVIWEVEDSDLIYNGNGEIQLTFSVDEVVAKSYISRIRIEKSLVPTGEVPTPIENWIDEANEILAEAEKWEDVTAEAETLATGEPASVEIVEESGHNKFVFGLPKGEEGEPGTPGFSPVIVVTDITGGHRVSITDVGGTHTVDIMDGEKGDTGNGIASAVLNQDYTLTLNFTDGTHYTTPSIRGAKGDKGDTGNGIASVALNQDYTLTITYTNGHSTTTTSIRGEKGETGVTPVISIGTVTTLQPGSDATASMDVTDPEHPVLSFGIPEGEPGEVTEAELTAVAESKAPVIINEASGAIASFSDGADGMLVKTLTVDIDPVQDLHGYDNPWPAGGGVNKCPSPLQTTITNSGLTFTCDGKGECSLSGTVSSGAVFDLLIDEVVLPSTVYVHLFNSNYYSENTPIIDFMNGSTTVDYVGINVTQNRIYNGTSAMGGKTINGIRIRVPSGFTGSVTFKIYISDSNAVVDFSPYSNICPISGWDSANVNRTGINIWDEVWESGVITDSGDQYNANSIRSKNYNMCYPSTEYYKYQGTGFSGYPVIVWYDSNKNLISRNTNSYPLCTSPANARYFRISMYNYGTTYNHDISINYPSTDTQYHAYSGSTAEYEFPQEAGTVYGGELTINRDGTGSLVVDRGKYTFTGNESQYVEVSGGRVAIKTALTVPASTNAICNEFIAETGGGVYFYLKTSMTAQELKTFMGNNDVYAIYKLDTPVTYQLTNQQVVSLLKGQNNVWADCGNISMEYPADTKLYIDGKMAEIQALILES